jgi:integrase
VNQYRPVKHGLGAGQLLRHVADPNRWLARVFISRDAKNRQQTQSKVVHGSRRQAEAVLAEMLQRKGAGGLSPRSSMRLVDLANEWITHKARTVSPRTLGGYEDVLRRYVLPSLGHRKIADLHLREIDRLYGLMLAGQLPKAHEDDDQPPAALSPRSVRLAHTALSQALSQAVSWGLLTVNPAAGATIPTSKPKEKNVLTASERARFLRAAEASVYRAFYRTLIDTGLRPGEACALLWTDVDFSRETISVQRTVTRGADGEAVLAEPKTVKSRRTVPMLGGLCDELLRHLDWQRERNLDAIGYVFTNTEGRPLRPWTFSTRDFERVLAAAGVTRSVTLYGCRHTFATLHVAVGTPLKVVSDLMGHANIQQTANSYMHGDQAVTADWMRRFEQQLDVVTSIARAPAN